MVTYEQLNNQPVRNTRLSNYLTNENNKGDYKWKGPASQFRENKYMYIMIHTYVHIYTCGFSVCV